MKNKYIFLIVITIIIGSLPCFLQYGDYILMDDFFRQEVPFIMETKKMFSSGIPFWSWNTYFGDNFLASYGFYTLTSPFVWFNCLFPYKWILHSLFLTLILKYICTFLAARMYLSKMEVSDSNANIGGLLYTFSSYAISNSFYYHFFEPMIVFPILLVAIEKYLREENYSKTTLVLVSFLTVFINYYFAICSYVAAAMYVFCRVFFNKNYRILLKRVPIGGLLMILGIFLDSFLLIPTAMHLSGGARTNQGILSGLDYTAELFFIERLRTLFMLQPIEENTSLFRGTGFNSCSVTLPVIGVFVALAYCWKYKKSWISGLVILSLIAFLTPINTVFSLFTNPNYTRWAYALSLFLILASVKWMDSAKGNSNISLKHFFIYGVVAISVFAFALWRGSGLLKPVNLYQFSAYGLLLLISLVCLAAYIYFSLSKKVLLGGIIICATAQMLTFNFLRSDICFSKTFDIGKKGIVKTYMIDNRHERNIDDTMHYRTAFEGRYPNLGLLLNYPSVSSFHSVLNTSLYQFVTIADTTKITFWNSFVPNYYRRSFYSLMSVKECVDYHDPYKNKADERLNYHLKFNSTGYSIYQNRDYIPMGFTYDSFICSDIVDSLQNKSYQPDLPKLLLSHLVIPSSDKDIFKKHLLEAKNVNLDGNMDSIVAKRRKYCSSYFEGNSKGFNSRIYLPKDNFVFYSIPADKGFTAYIDGTPTPIYQVNLGLSAIEVPKGVHEVKFSFIPQGFKEGIIASTLTMFILFSLFYYEKKQKKYIINQ